jgi:hypothetical protein
MHLRNLSVTKQRYPSWKNKGGRAMFNSFYFAPILSLVAGIASLIVPRMFHYIIVVYLIMLGLAGQLSAQIP